MITTEEARTVTLMSSIILNRGQSFEWDGEKIKPTVHHVLNFNVLRDCENLKHSMSGTSKGKAQLIELLSNRSSEQRVAIVQQFKSMYGTDLMSRIKSEFKGCERECLLALCRTPAELDAYALYRAMKGRRKDVEVITEILCSRNKRQLKKISDEYAQAYPGHELEKDIRNSTSRHLQQICIAMLQAKRDDEENFNKDNVRNDVDCLQKVKLQNRKSNDSEFTHILVSRSYSHLRLLFDEYPNIGKQTIEDMLKSEVRGSTLDAYLSIIQSIRNRPKYFAEKLVKVLSKRSPDHKTIIRIVVSRSELDMGEVKKEFHSMTGKTLEAYFHDKTKGDYRKILLALVGA
uniref:Annexin n=1 Tax=Trichobilharzia regenti TaxID=157069 RepID=A0AA85KLH9_TRIRE|nr:unnamed protein product [Trichobilharzia regenti]